MALHPDLAAFLELVEFGRLTGRSLPMHAMEVAQARAEFADSSQVLDPSPPGNLAVKALQITARDGARLAARLYRQGDGGSALQPVILYLHGGGYVVGSLDSHDSVCRRLAALGEFAVLAADYRLAPEQQFPVALHDVLDAANWLAEQAAALGLDNRRVVLAGDSVGASLATVLAITAVEQPEALAFKPLAQLLFYPVTDVSCQRDSHRQHGEGYLLETPTLEWFYQHYVAQPAQRLDWRVSPLLSTLRRPLAPAYLFVAEYDPLHDEGIAYRDWLTAGGTAVTFARVEGLTHDFLRMSGIVGQVQGIYRDVGVWLKRVCGQS
ncbi:alpha/beta hydrolase [Pseudomonas sp. AFG_SD02_1510_Pfu_092]|uniref:alpha/beta hydrolase n=1 Tax=Pseudomonas sp. AFG_SD02_1510_Pfu_092 TaxID=2259497 RepID=UPI000DEFEA35|nr:alpha/beta hydrolase [Pseudomonas sp. AFG_SD02_1510_Pfu_092]RCL20707.1 alpha/beta hydrolase [Pseudomonas sp. AFG_SD02_1510_Pfu_092]